MPITKRIIDLDEKARDSMLDVRGPPPERLARAGNGVSIGGDERGVQIYHILDAPLDEFYGRLVRDAGKNEGRIDALRIEYRALKKYRDLYESSGMIGTIGSVDPNRTYSPSPFGRDFCAKSDRSIDDRKEYYAARYHIDHGKDNQWGHKSGIVADNIVIYEADWKIAAYCVGKEIEETESILRDAGYRLAGMWGMTR